MRARRNKTVAAWLAFLGGPLGLHRFYLGGPGDTLGWLLPVPTALGLYGLGRARQLGMDDMWSWLLIPLLGAVVAACCLTAIVYGLTLPHRWNARHNPQAAPDDASGSSSWLTVLAVIAALMVGAAALLAGLAYGFEHYFSYALDQARARAL